jgi:hypothetical protein
MLLEDIQRLMVIATYVEVFNTPWPMMRGYWQPSEKYLLHAKVAIIL